MIGLIHARLDATLPRDRWDGVEVAEDLDELVRLAGQVHDASAIVMPFRERAGRQMLATGGHRQRVEEQFVVGIVVRIYSDRMGAERALRHASLREDVEQALAGWTPASAVESCELVGGESSPIDTGVSIYAQTWATARFLTGA